MFRLNQAPGLATGPRSRSASWCERPENCIGGAGAELPVEGRAAEEQSVVDRADHQFVDETCLRAGAEIATLDSPVDDRLNIPDARLDDPLSVGVGQLQARRELGDEPANDFPGQRRTEHADGLVREAGQLLPRVAEVGGRLHLLQPVEEDRECQFLLPRVPAIDRGLADAGADGYAFDREAADSDLLEQLPRCAEDRLVGALAEPRRPPVFWCRTG